MDGLIDRSRPTGSRERASYHAGVGLGSKDSSLEGYGRVGKHTKHYTVDFDSNPNNGSATEDIFCNALHGGQHKEVDETLLKSHKEEKKPSLVENRRSSPSVIARLMGLDELPLPAVLSESRKDNAGSLLKNSFVDFEENYKSSGRHEYTTSRSGIQTSRAAQELVSSSNAKKHNDQVVPENLCSKPDVAFIMKQFVEANCLSTSETLQESKELNDELDVLDANKDLFIKFLREPNSAYAKHLNDLKFSKCFGQMSDTRFSKPLDGKMHENNEPFYRVVEETEQCKEKHKDAAYCCSKSTGNLAKHSANMPTDSLLQKLLRSRYAGKFETSSHTTSIVLLKPSFQKVQSTIRADSLSRPLQSRHPICRRRGDVRQDLLDDREQSESFDLKTGGYKAKGARELFGDNLHPVKLSSRSCSQGVRTLKVENYDSSSSHLSEPYLSREARKRLSERWKLTQPSNVKLLEGTSTLAEMLSLSDTEAPSTLDQFIRVSDENVANDDIHESRAYPSGISSRDGWKDDSGTSVAKSKHLPASTTIYGTSKPQSGKQVDSFDDCYMLKDVLNLEQNDLLDLNIKRGHSLLRNFKNWQNKRRNITSCGEENKSPECEVELHHDDQRRKIFLNDLIEHKTVFSRLSQRNKADLGNLVYSSSTPKSLGSNIHALAKLEEFQQPVKLNGLSSDAIEEEVAEGPLFDSTEVEASLEDLKQYEPSIVPKFAEHPSPVSVLDPPSEDEKSSPECLESISAALQDLQLQLDLLKLDSVDSDVVQPKPHILSEDAQNKLLRSLNDGDSRDFLYLLDMLTVSGIYAADQRKLFDACYSPDYPVFSDVFDKIEKKYDKVDLWLKSERKLLFDQINSILAEVLAPCIDLHPWVKSMRIASCRRERLAQECWRMVVMQQKESSRGKPEDKVLDTRWLHVGDDINMVGREIERMMTEDLLDELVSEFILGT